MSIVTLATSLTEPLVHAAIVFSTVLAGIYFIFSNTVLPVLSSSTSQRGIEIMQRINQHIQNPMFFLVFFGSAATALALFISQLFVSSEQSSWLLMVAACMIFSTFVSTVVFNVPLNERLEKSDSNAPTASAEWEYYLEKWVPWNHFRTLMTLLSTSLMVTELSIG
jgi:uncharacterized membrane protein